MTWTPEQLATVGEADEAHISTYRRDGSLRSFIPIWVVRVDNDLFVRSAYGAAGGWYRHATHDGRARIHVHEVETDVALEPVTDAALNEQVARAYRAKYAAHPAALGTMLQAPADETTQRLLPSS